MPAETLFEVKFRMPSSVEPSGDQPKKWAKSLTTNAELINDRRQRAVGSEGDFQAKMSGPSSVGFTDFVEGSEYVTRGGRSMDHIKEAQAANLENKFSQWSKALDYVFETIDGVPGKRFVELVNNKIDNTAVAWALKGLRITGDKIRGLGLATKAAYWLTGDNRGVDLIRAEDIVIAGKPTDTQKDGLQNAFKAAFVQKVIQAGMLISNAKYSAARLTEQNAILNAVCNGYRDTAKADSFDGTNAFCKFIVEDNRVYLHVKAILTPP